MFPKEDGTIFFKDAYEKPWLAAIFSYYAGYLTILARIISAACEALPLSCIPAAYAWSSLVIAAAALCFFYLPYFRLVIASDRVRCAVVLALPFMPNAESLMRLSGVLWYAMFALVLITMMELPSGRMSRCLLWSAAAVAAWSNPVSIVCVPVLALRALRADTREVRRWWAALAFVTVAYALTAKPVHSALGGLWQEPAWPRWLINALSLRVFCFFFLGDTLARCFLLVGWGPIVRLGLLLAAACVTLVLQHRRRTGRTAGMTILYFVFTLPMLMALRPEWLADFGASGAAAWAWHGRYFYLSTLLLCVLCGIGFEMLLLSWTQQMLASAFLLGWLSLHLLSLRQGGWQATPGWQHYARAIRAAEAAAPRAGGSTVHIVPADTEFSFDLVITNHSHSLHSAAP